MGMEIGMRVGIAKEKGNGNGNGIALSICDALQMNQNKAGIWQRDSNRTTVSNYQSFNTMPSHSPSEESCDMVTRPHDRRKGGGR